MVRPKESPGRVTKRNCRGVKKRNSLGAKDTLKMGATGALLNALPAKQPMQTAIKVVVRVRPTNEREANNGVGNIIQVVDDQKLILDPEDEDEGFFYQGVKQPGRNMLKKPKKNMPFTFDRVFDNSQTTQEVFLATTHSLIEHLIAGFNCSVFAYGATGAGKTFTMTGSEWQPGIICLTMEELFRKFEERKEDIDFDLGITFVEVYNELVKDLLNPGAALNLLEDARYGVSVSGIKVHKIQQKEELFKLLIKGNKNRTQHPTDANAESSRSHSIFQVLIQMKIKGTNEMRRVKLNMIDLAGSERGQATNFTGARFKEGANINKSLLALGNCINALADGKRHVPYRDSKLTRLLKDSLGGNCHTVMIVNVSPSSTTIEDTYNSLKYAKRAMSIKYEVKSNIVSMKLDMGNMAKINNELKSKYETLMRELAEKEKTETELKNVIEDLNKRYDALKMKYERDVIASGRVPEENISPSKETQFKLMLEEKENELEAIKKQCLVHTRRHNETTAILHDVTSLTTFLYKQLHGYNKLPARTIRTYESLIAKVSEQGRSVTFDRQQPASDSAHGVPSVSSTTSSTTEYLENGKYVVNHKENVNHHCNHKMDETFLKPNATSTPTSTPDKTNGVRSRVKSSTKKGAKSTTPALKGILKKTTPSSITKRPRFKF